jgi:hypothetical protein
MSASRARDILQTFQGLCGLVIWKVSRDPDVL